MAQFRHRRDEEIGKSIVRFIREHPGMRIAMVMGANHHVFAVEMIEENFGKGEVLLVRG